MKTLIDVVSIKMVKEKEVEYNTSKILATKDVVDLFKSLIGDSDRENAILCCLDAKNKPINVSIISTGSLNSSIVHPREIFKTAILSNAASIILGHNHPSGDTTPSNEDKLLTIRVKEAGDIIGIKLLDHVIIGDGYLSMKEEEIF